MVCYIILKREFDVDLIQLRFVFSIEHWFVCIFLAIENFVQFYRFFSFIHWIWFSCIQKFDGHYDWDIHLRIMRIVFTSKSYTFYCLIDLWEKENYFHFNFFFAEPNKWNSLLYCLLVQSAQIMELIICVFFFFRHSNGILMKENEREKWKKWQHLWIFFFFFKGKIVWQ